MDIFASVLEILSSDKINILAKEKTYEEWLICNGIKRDITKEDGVKGYDSVVAINHSLIYLKSNVINSVNKKSITDILDKWLPYI